MAKHSGYANKREGNKSRYNARAMVLVVNKRSFVLMTIGRTEEKGLRVYLLHHHT